MRVICCISTFDRSSHLQFSRSFRHTRAACSRDSGDCWGWSRHRANSWRRYELTCLQVWHLQCCLWHSGPLHGSPQFCLHLRHGWVQFSFWALIFWMSASWWSMQVTGPDHRMSNSRCDHGDGNIWTQKKRNKMTELCPSKDGMQLPTSWRGDWKRSHVHASLSPYAVCRYLYMYTCMGVGAHTGWPSC